MWRDGAAVHLSTTRQLFIDGETDFVLRAGGLLMGTPLQPRHGRRRGPPPPKRFCARKKSGMGFIEFAIGHEKLPPLLN